MAGDLTPSISTDELYPANAVYMARTDLEQTKFLGFRPLLLDTVTSYLIGLLNGKTAIRHEAGATEEIFNIYRYAGIAIDEETLVYHTAEEADSLADKVIGLGKKLFSPYPLKLNRFPADAQLVPPELYKRLNAKANLGDLVLAENLPRRKILSYDEFSQYVPSEPVFFKSASDASTGWGFAVQSCRNADELKNARQWFKKYQNEIHQIIVEEWVDVSACWCVGVAVSDKGVICLGGAEQTFSSPARQSGNIIDPENALPKAGEELAVNIGEIARKLGFRGIAGFDIGLRNNDHFVVFDPNFRFNSSTTQLLFHHAASERSGYPVSCSLQCSSSKKFRSLSDSIRKAVDCGHFVPTRIFDGGKHPYANGKHIVTGFVLGGDRQSTQHTAKEMMAEFEL